MMMRVEHLLLMLGGALLGVGLILGLMPVTAEGVSCGTGVTGASGDAFVSDLTSSMLGRTGGADRACADALSSRRAVAWGLLIPGAVLTGAGLIVLRRTRVEAELAAQK